jgi:hypothetical protein
MSGGQFETAGTRGAIRAIGSWLNRPWSFQISLESLTWAAVALGVFLRIWDYLDFRQLYMDEVSLLKNLVGRPVFEFKLLVDDQMAPPGFLVIERLLLRLPLSEMAAGRLFPLFCGVATVFLFRAVANRYLDRWAVPIAVALFAMADHLLYYSAEIKQYSCDLMLCLVTLLLAAPSPRDSSSTRRSRALQFFGLVAPWFSFTVVFPLAVAGLHQIVTELQAKHWKQAARTCAICLAWAVSFAGCYLLSRSILSQRDFIWVWWNFAFLPLPPRSLGELSHLGETLANVFINPGSLISPLPMPYTAALASLLWLYGFLSLGRRWPGGLLILAGPLGLALAASGLHLYPFHGRLLLYLVPSFVLLMAEGMAFIGRRRGWITTLLLASMFLYGEAAEIFWQRTIQPRARTFDSHGDLKNDLLDYLDYEHERQLKRSLETASPRVPGE